MKKSFTAFLIMLTAVFFLSAATCFSQSGGGGKSLNSPETLKEYLDNQPANSPDKPIKVTMVVNDPMLPKIAAVLRNADKYVSLNISGNAITSIPGKSFLDCKTLVSITIPNSVTSIGNNAFQGCTSLTSVTIPDSVNSIGNEAFYGCTSLTAINVDAGNSAYSSQDGVLYNKAKTTLVAYPGGKAGGAFTIPNSVNNIGDFAFQGCTSLTSVTIPDSVTSIGQGAFYECTNLTSVTFATGSNISDADFGINAFPQGSTGGSGDTLKNAYSTGKAGTYTRTANGSTWSKQP